MHKSLCTPILAVFFLLFSSEASCPSSVTSAAGSHKAVKQTTVKAKKRPDGPISTPPSPGAETAPARVKRPPLSALKILGVRIYLSNNKPQMTVPKDKPELTAYAVISFEGSGPFKGFWQVNGKVHALVNMELKRGSRITIETPRSYPLPTSTLGAHRIGLVVTTPTQKRPFPTARYMVTQSFPKGSPEYGATVQQGRTFVPGQVIVVFKESQRVARQLEAMERKFDLRLIDAHDLKTLSLRIALFRTETDVFRMVERLGKERDILLAQPNRVFRTMAEPLCEMQKIYRILNLKEVHKYGRGKGVKVAVVDTGVDKNHKDLKARIGSCENFVKRSPYKGEIHGTAVAGVIGASINGYGIVGVAPETEILALRSCRQISEGGPEGECYTSSLSRALDAALAKRADVVNMSFGAAIQDSLLRLLIEEGAKRKIVFTAPAGNRADQKDLWFPASHPKVLAVAGMDQKGHPYPNRDIASKADTCAPATNVFTTIPGSRHNFINGTSMASAVVAGLIAVKISKNGPLNKGALPAFNGDVCKWTEELLRISICEKQH